MRIAYAIGTILLGLVGRPRHRAAAAVEDVLFTAPLFAHIEVFGCTPVLVQIVWVYYALPVVRHRYP